MDEPTPPWKSGSRPRHLALIVSSAILWVLLVAVIGRDESASIAANLTRPFQPFLAPASVEPPSEPVSAFRLRDLRGDAGSVFLPDLAESRYFPAFLDLLNQNIVRHAVDDNFTVRVYDTRRDSVLEVFELESTRAAFRRADSTDWEAVDDQRRRITRILVDKYEKAGVPEDHITVRWGRADQVRRAYRRNEPYLVYELRLARWLDLSLLATQIGMIETFNQPELVSAAGARSQYQMVPYVLRQFGIARYDVPTTSGSTVRFRETLHPLLTMEPALYLVRAYANAVGHEIPGLSAYHTGPGNIFNLYRQFLATHPEDAFEQSQSVLDAYLWGLTDGFDRIRRRTSFGHYSRGYVPSTYGALEAVEDWPVDTSRTVRTERVRLSPGREITLHELLGLLESGTFSVDRYAEFRRLNPHADLPKAEGTEIPEGGDLVLRSEAEGDPLRFFLPAGASTRIEALRPDLIDASSVRRYDGDTYRSGRYDRLETEWDRAYRDLVDNVRRFGFSRDQRETLDEIVGHFERLAEERPTPYRERQLAVAEIHHRMWESRPWRRLADVVAARRGSYIVTPRPLELPDREVPVTLRDGR